MKCNFGNSGEWKSIRKISLEERGVQKVEENLVTTLLTTFL